MLCVMFCILLRSVECNCHTASRVHVGCAQHPFYIGFNVNFTIYILPCSGFNVNFTTFYHVLSWISEEHYFCLETCTF